MAEHDMERAAIFLSTVVDFMAVHGKVVEVVAQELARFLLYRSHTLEPEHLCALSRDSFRYYLDATKSKDEEPKFLTDLELLRFRNVVLWFTCKEFAPEESIAVQLLRPEIQCVRKLLEKSPQERECLTTEEFKTYRKMKDQLQLSIREYLPLVQFRRIPPEIIKNIVRPMSIVPSSHIKKALKVQAALQLSVKTEEDNLGWSISKEFNKQFEVYECESEIKRLARDESARGYFSSATARYRRGSLIKQVASGETPGETFVLYNYALNQHVFGQIYNWEIVIEEVCESFIDIGLHIGFKDLNYFYHSHKSLWSQDSSYALRLDSSGMYLNHNHRHTSDCQSACVCKEPSYEEDCTKLIYGTDYAHKSSKIGLCLDMTRRECSFTIDDKDFGAAWTELPEDYTYIRAVSLGTGSYGAVSLNFLSLI